MHIRLVLIYLGLQNLNCECQELFHNLCIFSFLSIFNLLVPNEPVNAVFSASFVLLSFITSFLSVLTILVKKGGLLTKYNNKYPQSVQIVYKSTPSSTPSCSQPQYNSE